MKSERFPIQGGITVSREAAEKAYVSYARKFGASQSLDRLAERGGFGIYEFVWLYLGARDDEFDRVDENRFARALSDSDIKPR